MVRTHGDPDGGAGRNLDASRREGLAHGVHDTARECLRIAYGAHAALQDGEFIAAETCEPVRRAQGVRQPARDLNDQAVAGVVAMTVVDVLEMINVEIHDRKARALAAAAGKLVIDPAVEKLSVGQS